MHGCYGRGWAEPLAWCFEQEPQNRLRTQPSQPSRHCRGYQPWKGSSTALVTSANSLRTRSSACEVTPSSPQALSFTQPGRMARPRPPKAKAAEGLLQTRARRAGAHWGPHAREVEGPHATPAKPRVLSRGLTSTSWGKPGERQGHKGPSSSPEHQRGCVSFLLPHCGRLGKGNTL